MKSLYIMRHAKSSWKNPRLSDHQRPLNKRGKRDTPDMGARLKARSVKPDRIVCSDARRALDTAISVADILGLAPSVICREPALYHAAPGHLLNIVKDLDDNWQCVMLVGHNPGLNMFVNGYYPHHIDNIPTAGIVELVFDINHWADIHPDCLTASSFDFPKNR